MLEKQLVEYMKEPGFDRAIELWIKQYKRFGKLTGSICIVNASKIEKEQLGGFLGKDFREEVSIHISWKQWEDALLSSKYENISFLAVLKLLTNEDLKTNKEKREIIQQTQQKKFEKFMNMFEGSDAGEWLSWLLQNKGKTYQTIKKLLKQGETEILQNVLLAINKLPFRNNDKMLLPLFSAEVAKSPHFFDKGTASTLLFQGICYSLHLSEKEYDLAERNKIMYDAGIIRDDLSNNCMIAHINALQDINSVHLGWNGFYKNYEPWNLNLFNLQQILTIKPSIKQVYIVENPSVFRELVIHGKRHNKQNNGYICSNGQLNLCTYVLLDLLNEQGIKMYYAGDFDPEGLLIADKLKRRYADCFNLWHYEAKDYLSALSNLKVSEKRLSIMTKCESEEVRVICDLVQKHQLVGFQELLLEQYIKDI